MIESTPALLAAHLRHSMEMEERLAAEIARREGLDLDATRGRGCWSPPSPV